MKTGKKLLSVLLALVMLASLGTFSFAADGDEVSYDWKPIPTSPEGLGHGAYYLDFTYDWENWSPDTRQARLDMLNAGEWYVDHGNRVVKGVYDVPAELSETGVAFVRTVDPDTDLYAMALAVVYDWRPIPTSSNGLSHGDFYLDFSFQANGWDPGVRQATLNAWNAGSWFVDYELCAVKGSVSIPAELSATGEAFVKTVKPDEGVYFYSLRMVGNWELLPHSADGLSDGNLYMDTDFLTQTLAGSNDPYAAARYASYDYYVDTDLLYMRVVGRFNGVDMDMLYNAFWLGVKEVGTDWEGDCWIPVNTYTEGLNEGDWYMDFEEELAYAVEQGIYAPGDTDGPHMRAMYERNGTTYYINPNSRIFKYKVVSGTSASFYPWGYLQSQVPGANNVMLDRFMNRVNRSIKQYHVVNYTWDPIPTSPDRLADGECYLDFTHIRDNYSDEHRPLAVAMYNEGEWYIDYGRMVLKGSIDIPPELYPHNQPYHMIYDPSTVLLSTCLREAGEDWRNLPYGPDGLNEGDYYLDTDTFMAIIGNGKTEEERDAVLELLKQHVVFSYNPNGVHLQYRFTYTDLPDETGTPVSGTTTLPLDLELNADGAYLFDYNALRSSVKQYSASEEPETPGNGSGATNFGGRLKAMIAAILSFFRKLFKTFSGSK